MIFILGRVKRFCGLFLCKVVLLVTCNRGIKNSQSSVQWSCFELILIITGFFMIKATRVEVPDVISAEQRSFIVLTFFSADSENMINISADQLCFRADQL